jgi:protein associated with RNAse G/E
MNEPSSFLVFDHLEDLSITIHSLENISMVIIVCIDGPTYYKTEILKLSSRATIIFMSRQRGAAYCRNTCIEYAQTKQYLQLCMLDAGVFVSKNWFDVLVMLPIDGIYAGVTSASPHRPDHWLSLQCLGYQQCNFLSDNKLVIIKTKQKG